MPSGFGSIATGLGSLGGQHGNVYTERQREMDQGGARFGGGDFNFIGGGGGGAFGSLGGLGGLGGRIGENIQNKLRRKQAVKDGLAGERTIDDIIGGVAGGEFGEPPGEQGRFGGAIPGGPMPRPGGGGVFGGPRQPPVSPAFPGGPQQGGGGVMMPIGIGGLGALGPQTISAGGQQGHAGPPQQQQLQQPAPLQAGAPNLNQPIPQQGPQDRQPVNPPPAPGQPDDRNPTTPDGRPAPGPTQDADAQGDVGYPGLDTSGELVYPNQPPGGWNRTPPVPPYGDTPNINDPNSDDNYFGPHGQVLGGSGGADSDSYNLDPRLFVSPFTSRSDDPDRIAKRLLQGTFPVQQNALNYALQQFLRQPTQLMGNQIDAGMFGQAATQRGQGREAVQAGLQARGITNSGLRGKAMARTDADYAGSALQTIEQARDADLQGKALRQQGILNLQNQWVSMITGLSDARLLGTAQANQQHVIDDKNTGAGIKGLITAGTLAAGGVQGAAAVNSQQGGGGGYPGQGQNYLGQGQQLQQNQDWYGQRYGNVPNNRRL